MNYLHKYGYSSGQYTEGDQIELSDQGEYKIVGVSKEGLTLSPLQGNKTLWDQRIGPVSAKSPITVTKAAPKKEVDPEALSSEPSISDSISKHYHRTTEKLDEWSDRLEEKADHLNSRIAEKAKSGKESVSENIQGLRENEKVVQLVEKSKDLKSSGEAKINSIKEHPTYIRNKDKLVDSSGELKGKVNKVLKKDSKN